MAIDGRQLTAAGGGEGKNIGDRGHREREKIMRKKEEGYGTALLREGKIRVWKEERGKNWERKDGKGSTSHFGCLTVSPCCGTRLKEKLAILMNVIAFEEPGRKFERKWEEETLS